MGVVSAGWHIRRQGSAPLRREASSFSKDLPDRDLYLQLYVYIWPIHLETVSGAQSEIGSIAHRL